MQYIIIHIIILYQDFMHIEFHSPKEKNSQFIKFITKKD